ncbi:GNAT family N-acetyltransferase [Streptomyces sp. NPDC090052]|uniref:GNAT family N-acetyltransferase n=1 Tax=unclassified Streptomyces TaxID=2593676 RepID=UPI00225B7E8B|nr:MULTISPECIES: GNAT family N-acetyltransferase [unclassified Streptomyces]MCX4729125.1 GNAT family N-acetyltransferase [Streptomyces sp. NBC_01306]WSV08079.1 GNAT family N-acetyltransferase [Streptomyces sp. NBC_01020]WSX46165.1 GNAT family N-acetyltransferase [Streptomyces sp. NBC_00963]WSX65761.1 GNAT family N-acetyltransferase [Streptomyces sp. NBC_00932]
MHHTEVRSATPAEATAISHLLAEAIRDTYTGTLRDPAIQQLISTNCSLTRIRAEIGIPGGAPGWLGWLVAVEGDAVVGAAAGGVPAAGEGELYSLCTALSGRGRGLGTALLAAVTQRMLDHDARQQAVTLHCEQDPTEGFFRRHGFDGPGSRLTRPV